ncbi:MAG TPA: DNA cytosine methyltransferase [Candidatus Saccharibacteria bacterium]|nr:DNA cytosine methyltransferase [Candidatus Saccharibacteria bacterium]HMR38610.1 DNA cytosine methyltransferase [Candidatus Saccharibacteria bacterium]
MGAPLTVIDLFSGVGGLSYGFANHPRFSIIAANEILPKMAKAYSLNHPSVKMYVDDVVNFSFDRVYADLGESAKQVDIIVGGPPCQAYSTVGKRWADDPRAQLFLEYHRILKEFQPKLFVFENVKGMLSMQGGELFKGVVALFESLGYRVQYTVLNAADYGAPQIRERIILVGTQQGKEFSYPEPTHYNPQQLQKSEGKLPYLTLGEAIGDLPLIGAGSESFAYASEPQNEFQRRMRRRAPEKLMDHNSPNNNANLVKIMQLLPDGGTPLDLPEELRPTSGYKNTYSRLWWDKPSTTITRNLSTPSSSRCIHPKAPRPLTTREGARLQCFPDEYQFYGSRSDRNLQIGNAVPTCLSVALAQAVERYFSTS